jgi:hypothetical protein
MDNDHNDSGSKAARNGGYARTRRWKTTTASDQAMLSIGGQGAHAQLRCNWVFVIVYAGA